MQQAAPWRPGRARYCLQCCLSDAEDSFEEQAVLTACVQTHLTASKAPEAVLDSQRHADGVAVLLTQSGQCWGGIAAHPSGDQLQSASLMILLLQAEAVAHSPDEAVADGLPGAVANGSAEA